MAARKKNKIDKIKKERLKVPVLGIADNIIFSKNEVWAYYKVSTVPYSFLSPESKASLAANTVTALAALCQSEGQKVDGQILITNTPFDVQSWVNQMDKVYGEWHNGHYTDVYNKYIDEQGYELLGENFQKPVVYLGIKMFTRGSFNFDSFNILEFGFKDAFAAFKKSVSNIFVMPNEEVSSIEEKRARDKETELFRTLSTGYLHCERPTQEELLLTIKRRFYPGMPVPYLTTDHKNRIGLNDIIMETGGVIENKYRYLKFNQEINGQAYTGYRATLSFARFPSRMQMPGPHYPFLNLPASRGLPYTLDARFSIIPQQVVKKRLNKKKLETDDEIENLANSGQASNAHIVSTVNDLSTLESTLEEDKTPWLNGSYRITVENYDLDKLKTNISSIKQAYADDDTTLVWSSGDQLKLFIEEIPGSNLQMPSFNQMTSLSMLGVSGFNIGGVAGDPIDEKSVVTKNVKTKKV